MLKKDLKKIDFLILDSLVNSSQSDEDIINMVQRFIAMRFQCEYTFPLNIQYPPSETKKG